MNQSMPAKPFLKWAGGKKQLLPIIRKNLPKQLQENDIDIYIEPFLGGGAVLFDMLENFNFKKVIVNDINSDLITTYKVVRDEVDSLIVLLRKMQNEYLSLDSEGRSKYYYMQRDSYNELRLNSKQKNTMEEILISALLIFLNRTCFNGLYRLNSKGGFNVPAGRYKNPSILNEQNLRTVSSSLSKVEFLNMSYHALNFDVDLERAFMYVDPPYRALPNTPSFIAYFNSDFGEESQIELSKWIHSLSEKGLKILKSNSDPKNTSEGDMFFEEHYGAYGFDLEAINAKRNINSKGDKRGQITELLIKNY